jgi:urea transporter
MSTTDIAPMNQLQILFNWRILQVTTSIYIKNEQLIKENRQLKVRLAILEYNLIFIGMVLNWQSKNMPIFWLIFIIGCISAIMDIYKKFIKK